jgi:hypothetical protein
MPTARFRRRQGAWSMTLAAPLPIIRYHPQHARIARTGRRSRGSARETRRRSAAEHRARYLTALGRAYKPVVRTVGRHAGTVDYRLSRLGQRIWVAGLLGSLGLLPGCGAQLGSDLKAAHGQGTPRYMGR